LVLVDHVLFFLLFIWVVIFNVKLNTKQSSKNINTYDVFMDEIKMENEPLQELEENARFQTKINRNLKNNENKMKKIWKSYMHKIILETN